jgi:Kef-type K+ transport system membrane component KefB
VFVSCLFLTGDVPPELVQELHGLTGETLLLPVLIQIAVLILAARAFAALFRRFGQPSVVGETAAGLLLGPSLFGWVWPAGASALFHPGLPGVADQLADEMLRLIFSTISELGLVFLLFLIGLEFDFSHLRLRGRSAAAIAVAGIVLPFGLGLLIAPVLLDAPGMLSNHAPVPPLGFALFLGTALSITAMPVLGRILMELNITRTRLASVTITAAAGDACGWMLLATVSAVVGATRAPGAGYDPRQTLLMLGATVAFGLVMVFLVRPLVCSWARSALRRGGGELGVTPLAVLIALILGCAIVTNRIGIFAIFGAFLFGAVLSGEEEFRRAVGRRLHDFVTAFFLPIFFTYTGLRTNVGTLTTPYLWGLSGLVLAAAAFGKLAGCGVAARLTGFSGREAGLVGVLMNTRGLMELVVINLGKDLGVVPDPLFCMLVLMALLTTVMTTPLVLWLAPGTELAPHIRGSSLGAAAAGESKERPKE